MNFGLGHSRNDNDTAPEIVHDLIGSILQRLKTVTNYKGEWTKCEVGS